MSEADKIIESLKNSGKKVEQFYVSNKTSDKNVANIEDDVMSQEAFNELIDNFEVVATLTMHGRKSIKHYVKEMQADLEQKDKKIRELEAKLEFKEFGDLDNVEFEEYMSQFIPKQDVIETLNRHKLAYEEFNIMYNNTHYEDDEIRARDFYVIVTEDRIVQVLTKLLGGEK